MSSGYTVQLNVYEGPLDLLLQLIEREELDITKVALAQVTDQYLGYLERFPGRPIGELADFLVVAAKLLQIKSEALLPQPPAREEGEEDPGEALARQLLMYRRFKQAASTLDERDRAGLRTYLRVASPPPLPTKLEVGGINIDELRTAMMDALAAMPDDPELEASVDPPKVLIRDKIQAILDALKRGHQLSFRRLLEGAETRVDIVVSFLAMLELVKSHRIRAVQSQPFSDIELSEGPRFGDSIFAEDESTFD